MPRRVFDFIEEPRGEALGKLLRALSHHASSATVVVRDDSELSDVGRAVLSRLALHLVEHHRASSWPGTTLSDEEATVFCFALSASVLDELSCAAEGLYGWQQPTLPEDVALLRADGSVILGSIAHEHDAFLELGDEEFESLVANVPGLVEMIGPQTEVQALPTG
jgi:hypothetical protein